MGATVEQVEIDGMFYCNHTIFKLIARCHSGLGKIEKKYLSRVPQWNKQKFIEHINNI